MSKEIKLKKQFLLVDTLGFSDLDNFLHDFVVVATDKGMDCVLHPTRYFLELLARRSTQLFVVSPIGLLTFFGAVVCALAATKWSM